MYTHGVIFNWCQGPPVRHPAKTRGKLGLFPLMYRTLQTVPIYLYKLKNLTAAVIITGFRVQGRQMVANDILPEVRFANCAHLVWRPKLPAMYVSCVYKYITLMINV